jgi:hypothetical protein
MATVSRSAKIKPIRSVWKSISIQWAEPGLSHLDRTTPIPHPDLELPALNARPILNGVRIPKPTAPFLHAVPADQATFDEWKLRPLVESFHPKASASDQYYTAGETARQEKLAKVIRCEVPSRAVVATKLTQWVVVEIETSAPQTHPPPLHLWAFLQPPGFSGTKGAFAGDEADSPVDFPRAGWGEYLLDPVRKTAIRRLWQGEKTPGNTQGDPDQFSGTMLAHDDWKAERTDSAGFRFRYKLKVEVLDERTDGDIRRSREKGAQLPEKDFEAGCWLKVWVRDPLAGWSRMPEDDESQGAPNSMDDQDPQRGKQVDSSTLRTSTPGAHAFLRERIFQQGKSKRLEEARPLYVLLLNSASADYLVEFERLLAKHKESSAEIVGSTAACTLGAVLLSGILRRILTEWNSKAGSRPSVLPHGVDWPEAAHRAQGEYLSRLVESFDVANLLAAYATTGFQQLSPIDAMGAAANEHALAHGSIAALYDFLFDLSCSTGIHHYMDIFRSRADNRKAARAQRLQQAKAQRAQERPDQLRVQQRADREEAWRKKGREKLDLHKRFQLGLSQMQPSAEFGTDHVRLQVPLVDKGGEEIPLIKPVGLTVPFFGLPLSFQAFGIAHGSVQAFLDIHPEADGSWTFGLGVSGDGALGFKLQLSTPRIDLVEGDPSHAKLDAQARDKLSQEARTSMQAGKDLDLVTVIKDLQEILGASIGVQASAELHAVAGFTVRWHPERGFENFSLTLPAGMTRDYSGPEGDDETSWETNAPRAFNANLGATLAAKLQFSVLHLDYPLAQIPKALRATAQDLRVNLDGTFLEKPFPGTEKVLLEWGKGKFLSDIRSASSSLPEFGTPANFRLRYSDLEPDQVSFQLMPHDPTEDANRSTSVPAIGILPKEAVQAKEDGEGKFFETTLRLTTWRKDPSKTGVVVADWDPRRKVLPGKKGHLSSTITSPGGKFLKELVGTGSAQFQIRASYLGSLFAFSDPLTLECPQILDQSWSVEGNTLRISLKIEHFHDSLLWVRIYSRTAHTFIELASGEDWLPNEVHAIGSGNAGHFLMVDWTRQVPIGSGDIYPFLSLVPHEEGLLNSRQGPPGVFKPLETVPSSPAEASTRVQAAVSDRLSLPPAPKF